MDHLIYASVRMIASTWYAIALLQQKTSNAARATGIMHAELYLSDLGIVDAAAAPYLEGAKQALKAGLSTELKN
ncbi:hypothetical protein [Deinococcus aquaedulcis]|uniref:hypothetical protein n=1 Tax=Deinococcus aquaedulcis TaxID=2840455 RepID=UPI001C839227|nr:hypothetical protein [Deinococcus aquaedulcis]